ncbi:unnamed protein product [Callosobruchus maculatus]|uniref:Uncharacterized protein n=1 Tax=Callosobruchus maculatus TaxID=64391 RepID=A0A653DKL9_CALMS|nr:unnamed protein product [Callosobruchus maculatus]
MNFKEALKDTSICKWLFGSDLDSTLKTAKELEKSTQQLKVPKKEGSTAEWATTSCSQQPSEELSADQTFPASNWKAGQGQRQEVSSITLEIVLS